MRLKLFKGKSKTKEVGKRGRKAEEGNVRKDE
jgi:hypothetical protein